MLGTGRSRAWEFWWYCHTIILLDPKVKVGIRKTLFIMTSIFFFFMCGRSFKVELEIFGKWAVWSACFGTCWYFTPDQWKVCPDWYILVKKQNAEQ